MGGRIVLAVTERQAELLRLVAGGTRPIPGHLRRAARAAARQNWLAGDFSHPRLTPTGERIHALLGWLATSEGHSRPGESIAILPDLG